jgi:hypothetical protein
MIYRGRIRWYARYRKLRPLGVWQGRVPCGTEGGDGLDIRPLVTLTSIEDSFSRLAGIHVLYQTLCFSSSSNLGRIDGQLLLDIMRKGTRDPESGRTTVVRSAYGRSIRPLLLGLLVLAAALWTVTNILRQAYTAISTNNYETSSSLMNQEQSLEDPQARFIREDKFR